MPPHGARASGEACEGSGRGRLVEQNVAEAGDKTEGFPSRHMRGLKPPHPAFPHLYVICV